MSNTSNTQEDRASGLGDDRSVPWTVKSVLASADFTLDVSFVDGTAGKVYLFDFIHAKDAGVFAALRDVDVFKQAFVDFGAVTWPGELDIAPDAMHDEIKAHGEWVL